MVIEIRKCPECSVPPRHLHLLGCDMEQCARCGGRFKNRCCFDDFAGDADRIPWPGQSVGVAECEQYGFFATASFALLTANGVSMGNVTPCDRDEPGAIPDLGRLLSECKWDPQLRSFVKR